jgi:hypothetical protein
MYTGRTDQDPTDPANGGRDGAAPQQRQTGVTDRDSGPGSDPSGGGRGGTGSRSTGISDTDSGPGSDPAGHGRGTVAGRGTNSRDRDFSEQPWNSDRYPSDSDRRDPQGEGRGIAAWAQRHQPRQRGGASTDGDVGPFRDNVARQGSATNLPPFDLADSDNPTMPNPIRGTRGNDSTTFQTMGRRINR